MKTEVSVVTFCQKGHKLYCPGDIILVMKMKAIAACPHIGCFREFPKSARIGNSFLVLLGCPFGRYDLGTTQATGVEKLFTNYNAFSFPFLFCFIFPSLKYNEQHAVEGKKKHLVHRGGKRFFVIM